ncbi:MAG: nodulation protein NfeD [Sulfurimonadaceae bacterium]
MIRLAFFVFLACISLFASQTKVLEVQIQGAISPASAYHLQSAHAKALEIDAQALLVKLDTPGGLVSSMREMIQTTTNSSLPVIVYVYPKGAHAASAGTYLLYASHVAAMAQGTNLGAATPVSLMPQNETNTSASATLEKKALSDAAAYIRSLAQMRDRNISWAEEAVQEAKSLSAQEALRAGVIEFVAEDVEDLLAQLDGKRIKVLSKEVVLRTENAERITYEADWKTKFLSVITNPNIAYLFILVAIYGIFFELMNPGGIFPGVLGAISGVVAMYALNMLPFNYAGLLLIFLGIAFMVLEMFVAGFGVLGIGGVIAFALGSVLLFDAHTLGAGISLPLIIAFSLVSLGFFIFVLRLFLRSRSASVVSGAEQMVGSEAQVVALRGDGYSVLCHGEMWHATCQEKLDVGEKAEVVSLEGLVLLLKPKKG